MLSTTALAGGPPETIKVNHPSEDGPGAVLGDPDGEAPPRQIIVYEYNPHGMGSAVPIVLILLREFPK